MSLSSAIKRMRSFAITASFLFAAGSAQAAIYRSVTIGQSGGSSSVSVTASIATEASGTEGSITISCSDGGSWCTASVTSSSFTIPNATKTYSISATANYSGAERTATVKVNHAGNWLYINVTQSGPTVSYQTVTFYYNDGTSSSTSKSYAQNGTYSSPPFPSPTRSGYSFDGWFTAATGGTQVYSSSSVTSASTRSLYAHWTLIATPADLVFFAPEGWGAAALVSSLVGSRAPMSSFTAGSTVYLSFCYGNSGETTAGAHAVMLSIFEEGEKIWSGNMPADSCNSGKALSILDLEIGTFDVPGSYSIQIALDSGNVVSESNEDNNVATVPFTVTAPLQTQVVTFNPTGGSCAVLSKTYVCGGNYSPLPTPTWPGYTFVGWFTAEMGGTPITETTSVTTSDTRTLYAHWTEEAKLANLVFGRPDLWGASALLASVKGSRVPETSFETGTTVYLNFCYGNNGETNAAEYAVSISLLQDGVQIDGWELNGPLCVPMDSLSLEDSAIGTFNEVGSYSIVVTLDSRNAVLESDEGDNVATINFTVTAAVPKQTVTFNANGGSCAFADKGYAYGGKYAPLPIPTREGYVFAGWFTAADDGTEVTEDTAVTTAFVRTLYAHWLCSPDLGFYADEGWASAAVVSSTPNSHFPEAAFAVGDTVYLSFCYKNRSEDLDAGAHTISATLYDGKGVKLGEIPMREDALSADLASCIRHVEGFEIGSFGAPGEYTVKILLDSENDIVEYSEENNERSVTFTVYEAATFQRVTFDYRGGSGPAESVAYMHGGTYGSLPLPGSRSGYDWRGWWTAASGGEEVLWSNMVSSASTRTLYAQWTGKTYEVTLDQQGGSNGTERVTATYGSNMPTITLPERDGYVFDGYYTIDGTQYYYSFGSSARAWAETTVRNRTLYAKWTKIEYTTSVTLDQCGGSGGTTLVKAIYGRVMPSVSMLPTRTGYTFGGYYSAANGSGTRYYDENGAALVTWSKYDSTFTLYAKWTANTYRVTLDRQGGSGGTTSLTATYGSAMPAITIPTRAGFTFGGYYSDYNGSGTQYYTSAGKSARTWNMTYNHDWWDTSVILYAKWIEKETPKSFGPGKVSTFAVSGIATGTATLVGMSGVSWKDFSGTDYYKWLTFVDANIVDAEKTAADDSDDYWCYQISDMNALYYTGWAKKTPYATVDDMKESFNAKLLRGGSIANVVEGKYGFVKNHTWGDFFDWYRDSTGIDLVSRKIMTEGVVGASFLSDLKRLMANGGHVVRINVFFDRVSFNEKWKGFSVSHGVLCVGYVANGDSLVGLFIVDPDNDMYTGAGGRKAPNSIIYCPVSWDSRNAQFWINGVWGDVGVILPEYRALATMPASETANPPYKVAFDANGGKLPKGKKMAAQTMTYGKAAKLTKNVFTRSGYVFAGWATSKANAKKGVIAYTNAQSVKNLRADGKTVTLYAVWAKPKYKVAFYANGGKGKMAVQTLKYGKAAKLAACKFKAPKGKKLAGWATSKANAKKGKVKYKNNAKVKNLLVAGKTVKLYAVWKKK